MNNILSKRKLAMINDDIKHNGTIKIKAQKRYCPLYIVLHTILTGGGGCAGYYIFFGKYMGILTITITIIIIIIIIVILLIAIMYSLTSF